MPKLELDLYYRDKLGGTTSIMIDDKPQYKLYFYSARPHKVPIPMNTTSKTSEGGLKYIGPLQTAFGFVANNTYVVEVEAKGVAVGDVVSLDAIVMSQLPGIADRSMDDVTITPVNEGKVAATGRAEFTVAFGKYPSNPRSIFWVGFYWEITSQWGKTRDMTPHSLVYNGDKFQAGKQRRLDPERIEDVSLLIDPGTHGFWVDILAIAGGGGEMRISADPGVIGEETPGAAGGSIPIFLASPLNNPCRYAHDMNIDANDTIPLAFIEAGDGQELFKLDANNVPVAPSGLAAQFITNLAAEFSGAYDIRVEKLALNDGLVAAPTGAKEGTPYGGFIDTITDGGTRGMAGQGRVFWEGTILGYQVWRSGCGAMGKFRIHCRRRSTSANIPQRAVNIRFKAAAVTNTKWHVPIVSPVKYATVKKPHVMVVADGEYKKLENTKHLANVIVGDYGGRGGYPVPIKTYPTGGQNGGSGSLGITDFGYYTTFA